MALIICEGVDRVGKTTVANYFSTLGYEVIHMSAPSKGSTEDSFLQEMIDLVMSASTKNIFLDRSYYGEAFIWPQVYGRKSLLPESNVEVLRELEDQVGVQRIWMTDDDLVAHWQRCVDNNEPLDKAQFNRARALYSSMALKYGFEKVTLDSFLKEYPDAALSQEAVEPKQAATVVAPSVEQPLKSIKKDSSKTPEQQKLEMANAINEILSKRILRTKNPLYDSLEEQIRNFLNDKLGRLFSGEDLSTDLSLTREEISFYKAMYSRAMSNQ